MPMSTLPLPHCASLRVYWGYALLDTGRLQRRKRGMARKAKKMAAKLIKIHTDHNERFILPQNELKTISGRKKITPRFLSTVDELLRRQGYALIDLQTEKGLIGVVSIEQVAQWGIPKMRDEVPQEDEEQEDDKVFNT